MLNMPISSTTFHVPPRGRSKFSCDHYKTVSSSLIMALVLLNSNLLQPQKWCFLVSFTLLQLAASDFLWFLRSRNVSPFQISPFLLLFVCGSNVNGFISYMRTVICGNNFMCTLGDLLQSICFSCSLGSIIFFWRGINPLIHCGQICLGMGFACQLSKLKFSFTFGYAKKWCRCE